MADDYREYEKFIRGCVSEGMGMLEIAHAMTETYPYLADDEALEIINELYELC